VRLIYRVVAVAHDLLTSALARLVTFTADVDREPSRSRRHVHVDCNLLLLLLLLLLRLLNPTTQCSARETRAQIAMTS